LRIVHYGAGKAWNSETIDDEFECTISSRDSQ